MGHIIDANGLHPSESKVKAIRDAPMPTNITELKSFLGLLNYYHKFSPDLSTTLAPLHQLLRKDAKWIWSHTQDKAFQQAKSLLQSSSLLLYYDEKKPLILCCDTSPYGLGAVLSHQMENNTEKPFAFTSRTLTTTEKKYSQLEKEALTIIFAVRKFHDYMDETLHYILITSLSNTSLVNQTRYQHLPRLVYSDGLSPFQLIPIQSNINQEPS